MNYKLTLSICSILFSLLIASPGWAIKPRPPLQLSLLQSDLSGDQSRLTLTATTNIDSSEVALSLNLPPGISLIQGSGEWKGSLQKGETKKIEVIVQDSDHAPRKVIGKATIHLAEGETFTQQSALTLNESKSGPPLPAPSIKRKEDGEKILEFKGR